MDNNDQYTESSSRQQVGLLKKKMIIHDIVVEHTKFNILQLLQNKKKSVKFTFCFIVSSNATQLEIKSIFWCMQRSIIHRKLWFIYLMGTVKYLLRVACLKDDDMKIFIFASAQPRPYCASSERSVSVQFVFNTKLLIIITSMFSLALWNMLNMSNVQGQKSPTPLMFLQIYRLLWWFKIQMA